MVDKRLPAGVDLAARYSAGRSNFPLVIDITFDFRSDTDPRECRISIERIGSDSLRGVFRRRAQESSAPRPLLDDEDRLQVAEW